MRHRPERGFALRGTCHACDSLTSGAAPGPASRGLRTHLEVLWGADDVDIGNAAAGAAATRAAGPSGIGSGPFGLQPRRRGGPSDDSGRREAVSGARAA